MMLSGCLITRFNKEMLRGLLLKRLGDLSKHTKCLSTRNRKQLACWKGSLFANEWWLRGTSFPLTAVQVTLPSWANAVACLQSLKTHPGSCITTWGKLAVALGCWVVYYKSLQSWHGCSQLLCHLVLNQAEQKWCKDVKLNIWWLG